MHFHPDRSLSCETISSDWRCVPIVCQAFSAQCFALAGNCTHKDKENLHTLCNHSPQKSRKDETKGWGHAFKGPNTSSLHRPALTNVGEHTL
eukprot:1157768-Pelagomonas_calceolata.AAC.9